MNPVPMLAGIPAWFERMVMQAEEMYAYTRGIPLQVMQPTAQAIHSCISGEHQWSTPIEAAKCCTPGYVRVVRMEVIPRYCSTIAYFQGGLIGYGLLTHEEWEQIEAERVAAEDEEEDLPEPWWATQQYP